MRADNFQGWDRRPEAARPVISPPSDALIFFKKKSQPAAAAGAGAASLMSAVNDTVLHILTYT